MAYKSRAPRTQTSQTVPVASSVVAGSGVPQDVVHAAKADTAQFRWGCRGDNYCGGAVKEAGEMVIDAGGELLSNQTLRKLGLTAGLVIHSTAHDHNMNEGAVNFVRDRIVGYPLSI
jgi:hypothetical protein